MNGTVISVRGTYPEKIKSVIIQLLHFEKSITKQLCTIFYAQVIWTSKTKLTRESVCAGENISYRFCSVQIILKQTGFGYIDHFATP